MLAAIGNAIASKGVFELEHRVLRVGGSIGWVFSRALPFLDERGEIVLELAGRQPARGRGGGIVARAGTRATPLSRELQLQRRAALALALMLHELATNAVKYGRCQSRRAKFASDGGAGKRSGSLFPALGGERRPAGGRAAPARLWEQADRAGFAQDLSARVNLQFNSPGVVCSLEAPLGELESPDH